MACHEGAMSDGGACRGGGGLAAAYLTPSAAIHVFFFAMK